MFHLLNPVTVDPINNGGTQNGFVYHNHLYHHNADKEVSYEKLYGSISHRIK